MDSKTLLQTAIECTKEYGAYTIEQRAIPDFRDGLKPVQRRVLWSMRKLGLVANGKYMKSARVVGDCFVKGTLVSTPNGKVKIENLKKGDLVNTSTSDPKKITEIYIWPEDEIIEIVTDGSSVECTSGQEFKVKIGDKFFWKKASELEEGDIIVFEI